MGRFWGEAEGARERAGEESESESEMVALEVAVFEGVVLLPFLAFLALEGRGALEGFVMGSSSSEDWTTGFPFLGFASAGFGSLVGEEGSGERMEGGKRGAAGAEGEGRGWEWGEGAM